MKNNNYFKYLTPGNEDIEWGFFLNVAGYATILPGEEYPPQGHPNDYSFDYETGRILHEYQINYITEGSGMIETMRGKFKINPGTILLLYPGVWHRYRPNKKTGWKEHYIGFKGEIADKFLSNKFFETHRPAIRVGYNDKMIGTFYSIIEDVKLENPGFQQVCSGTVVNLLGQIISTVKNKDFDGKEIEEKIRKARIIIRDNVNAGIDPEKLASDLFMSYSYFRKLFKKYTGVSPTQYVSLLRIQKARDMIINSQMPIKQIAYECGFPSIFYFSRYFKQKLGVSPSELRKKPTEEDY
jgi:AraC-like DNA-binding protein